MTAIKLEFEKDRPVLDVSFEQPPEIGDEEFGALLQQAIATLATKAELRPGFKCATVSGKLEALVVEFEDGTTRSYPLVTRQEASTPSEDPDARP